MPEPKRPLKVFLCHASADKPAVRNLYKRLVADGVDAWLDAESLVPGQNWQVEIPKAIRESDVVIVCLSEKSINKEGYVQREIKFALDVADEKPEGTIFVIPARLEECKVPDRLSMYHWVELFEKDGYERLVRALRLRADKIDATLQIKKNWLPKKPTEIKKSIVQEANIVTSKPKGNSQIAYWLGGFVVLILGIVLFSSLNNPSQTIEPTSTITNIPLPSTTITSKTPDPQMTLTVTPLPTATAIGGGAGKIIFSSFKDGENGSYTVNGDGSELRKLTDGLYNDYVEAFSPDNKKILFSSIRENKRNLYVMDVNGENVVKITNVTGSDWVYYTGWSPDSSKILYKINGDLFLVNIDGTGLVNLEIDIENTNVVSWSRKMDKLLLQQGSFWNGDGEIYVVNLDGTDLINITKNDSGDWFEGWLSNDEEIIFSSDRDGNRELYKVAVDGSDIENLTQAVGDDIFGSFSLSNGSLFFSSNRSGNYDVYKMDLKDFSVEPLTSGISDDYYKSVSPDESRFAYEGEQGGNIEVYVANIDGSNPINVTQSIGEDRFVDWMPNSESILFSSNRKNNIDYFSVNFDGTNLINLTKNLEHDNFISWSPDSKKMLFSFEAVSTFRNQYGREVQDEDVVIYEVSSDGFDTVVFSSIPLNYNGVSSVFWSPDSSKVVISLYGEGGSYTPDMFIVDLTDVSITKIILANGLTWLP